ncbi:hypothetical protein LINPERHAP1_LOCUS13004, partial [Linum perenne]
ALNTWQKLTENKSRGIHKNICLKSRSYITVDTTPHTESAPQG